MKVKLKMRTKGLYRLFGSYRKKIIGFRFEHYAWFFAFDYHNVDPWQFDKLTDMEQLVSICYGAAKWDALEKGKKFPYTVKDMEMALRKASMETNEYIGTAMAQATWPGWMKQFESDEAKKKSEKNTS